MCGILGTTYLNITGEKMKIALKEIVRRGPDNQDIVKNKFVYFGHTRLSILDLEQRSNQPFSYKHQDRNILVTFNGEIYNYLIIKEDLIKKGYLFNTNSDTEVVCAAYCEYGLDCFDFFEGMWAVAINEGSDLVLSRDRLGKKPLYYSHIQNESVFFGSSLKSVSILSGQDKLNPEGIELYFALGFIPKHYSIIENISKIEPGNIYHFEIKDEACSLLSVSKSKFKEKGSLGKLSVKKIIYASVEKRLQSDVPVTTLMSGGMDSTIVTSILNKLKPKVEAYFVDFKDKRLSEKKWADYLAARNGIKLNRFLMPSEDLNIAFKDYYSVYEEPFADYSGIPSIAIFKEVSKKYKVVLTGDGGDELFYGYPHYYKKTILYLFFNILKRFRDTKFLPQSVKTIVNGSKNEFESNYLKNHGILTPFATSIINKNFNDCIKKSKSFLKGVIEYDRDFYNWPEKYLVKVDRSSMFSAVEVRSPFMDENLIGKINKIPTIFLFTPYSSKLFLKLVFFKTFGLKYFTASKKGFTPPIDKLRDTNFREEDFLELKLYLKINCPNVYKQIKKYEYRKLRKDKILFDRFFFFNEWKNSLKDNSLNN
ncbi:asparagine synthase (glutamine-hydrolyzing) [Tenacibaculum aiptasiae]|uniref:asparagine synthase (glutamine-hydrolyzing) n=1 Tax=Tenacibaculum aiptasiae TaxID=426481 RepID=UPI00232BF9E8|nr:asparagine synthase (glutamine-hydrolyzing) [Tenacibaculum aiptasiae]